MLAMLLGMAAATATPSFAKDDFETRDAILAACYDNIDGQLQGDVARVSRSLHPEVIMRAVDAQSAHKSLALEIESRETLLDSTRKGILKLPEAQWDRRCEVLSIAGNAAAVRLETPDFVSFDSYGNFDGKWLLVNSFWSYKSKPAKP